jgi:spore coat protein A, manganese oxidase
MKLLSVLSSLALLLQCPNGATAFPQMAGLMDPDTQPKFVEPVMEGLSPSFKIRMYAQKTGFLARLMGQTKAQKIEGVVLNAYQITQETGLIDPTTKARLKTTVFGYGTTQSKASWPGPTIEARYTVPATVQWANKLVDIKSHPFSTMDGRSVLDKSLHWAYSLEGYKNHTVEANGIPILTHLHGIHADPRYDGHPDKFFGPNFAVKGPDWQDEDYVYPNDQTSATLWYHDHSLGITRLNVYAGLSGFYLVRDSQDTGQSDNKLGLPAGEFEKVYSIQDRMFKKDGSLFYPSVKGDPFYADWITEEMKWDSDVDGPSCLGEFFGDFILVNGKIWPTQRVQGRTYRLHLLNGCDTRYLALQFFAVEPGATTAAGGKGIKYTIVGADQGLMDAPVGNISKSLLDTGGRLDIVIDFRGYEGKRIIMTNTGGDVAFRGELPGIKLFDHTNLIMAFDVDSRRLIRLPSPPKWQFEPKRYDPPTKVRRVGLFEGRDQYGRLQPSLGGELVPGIVESFTWGEPNTEIVKKDDTEDWEIFNFSSGAVRALCSSIIAMGGFLYAYTVSFFLCSTQCTFIWCTSKSLVGTISNTTVTLSFEVADPTAPWTVSVWKPKMQPNTTWWAELATEQGFPPMKKGTIECPRTWDQNTVVKGHPRRMSSRHCPVK